MNKLKKIITHAAVDKKTHSGYNEKNPAEPQGSFKADSMESTPEPVKKGIPSTIRNKKLNDDALKLKN